MEKIFDIVITRLDRDEYDFRSILMLYRLSEFGHSSSQIELANITSRKGNFSEAIKLYQAASFSEPQTAIFNLALTFREKGDTNKYVFWMKKLADRGDIYAKEELAEFFSNGT